MMERHVKERLIGATLLVALIVLIVPEMLSGPKPPSAPPLTVGMPTSTPTPLRSVSVDLATSKATAESDIPQGASAAPPASAAASGTAPDEPPPAASAPAAGNDSESEGESSAPTVTTLKAQEPSGAPLETPASGPKSTAGTSTPGTRSDARADTSSEPPAGLKGHRGWAVQLGSFASRANAEKLVHQLQARGGSSPYVSASGSGPSLRYRVRVGPLADRGAAERTAGKLRAAGHPATLVAPAS